MKLFYNLKFAVLVVLSILTLGCKEETADSLKPIEPPKINSILPTSGKTKTIVFAEGVNIDGIDSVKLGKFKVNIIVSNTTGFSFEVPANAITGKLYVYKASLVDSSQIFTVIQERDELDVEPIQNVLIGDFTATWCGPCGQWGKPLVQRVSEKYGNKSIKVSFHSSNQNDILYTEDSEAYGNYLNINGFPTQTVNLVKVIINFPKTLSEIEAIITNLSDSVVAKEPEAVVGLSFFENSTGNYTINTKTHFLKDMPLGLYNVAVFIVQDNIIEPQNGGSQNFEHNGTFRKIALNNQGLSNPWGSQLNNPNISIKAGDKINKSFSVQAPTVTGKLAWKKQSMKAVAIIYKMNGQGTRPEVVINSNIVQAK